MILYKDKDVTEVNT